MADDKQKFFGKGIGVAAGFDLGAQAPLDAREVVNTREELAEHIAGNRAYEGMVVYIKDEKKSVQLDANGQWKDFGFDEVKVNSAVDTAVAALRSDLEAADEGLEGRIEALEGLVVGVVLIF